MTVEQIVNHQLELRIIGTTLVSPQAASSYVLDHQIGVEHFTADGHRTLWGLIRHRLESDGTLDDIVLDDTLRRNPDLSAGGVSPEQALEVAAAAIEQADAEPNREHAVLLKDLAERRRLGRILTAATRSLTVPHVSVNETVTNVTEGITSDSLVRRGPQIRSARVAIEEALHSRRWENLDGSPGLTVGFSGLDRELSLRMGTVTVIAARPSMGKSLFVQQVISHGVRHHRIRALLFSMEMEENELTDRLASYEGQVPGRWLQRETKPKGTHQDRWNRLLALADDTNLDRYEFVDDTDLSASDIVTLTRRHKAKHPDELQLVVVDYLGLIRRMDAKQLPVHAFEDITRQIKIMAMQQKVAVLLLAQLNRNIESENRRPRLSDLRDSGAIEQTADNVLFLHAQKQTGGFGEAAEPATANELIIAKQRSGTRQVIVPVDFDGSIPQFVDRQPRVPQPPAPTGVPLPDIRYPEAAA